VAECVADLVERDVGEHAAIAEILHVPPAAEVERVIDRISRRIPVERLQPELLGQLLVEGRCRLHPVPVETDVCVAMIEERVAAAHQIAEPFGRHVAAHVGVSDPRRDADGAAHRSHQPRLVDAIAVPAPSVVLAR
jgi:hypothetical protein